MATLLDELNLLVLEKKYDDMFKAYQNLKRKYDEDSIDVDWRFNEIYQLSQEPGNYQSQIKELEEKITEIWMDKKLDEKLELMKASEEKILSTFKDSRKIMADLLMKDKSEIIYGNSFDATLNQMEDVHYYLLGIILHDASEDMGDEEIHLFLKKMGERNHCIFEKVANNENSEKIFQRIKKFYKQN